MNKTVLPKYKLNRMFANVLSIVVILVMAFPATGRVSAQENNPFLVAFPEWWSVEGYGWPAGAVVHLSIDDPATAQSPDFEQDKPVVLTPWDPNGLYVKFNFWPEYKMKAGDVVTLNDGAATATHTVRNLSVTGVDVSANTVIGTADVDAEVQVNPYEDWNVVQTATTGENGVWVADFSGVYDFVAVTGGRSQIIDEFGNRTAVDWAVPPPPPSPWLIAFPENDAAEGWEWSDGLTVTLTIDHAPVDFARTETSLVTTWGDPRTYVRFDFADGYDLQIGDQVTLTGEDGTTRTHTVQNLSITGVNMDEDIVYGTANPGTQVDVWAHQQSVPPVNVIADEDGKWQADLTGMYDITFDTAGRSQVMVDGNATAVDWSAPPSPPVPWLIAFPQNDAAEGWEWPVGDTVTLTIDNAPEGFERIAVAEVTTWGDPRTYVRFDFADAYDLQEGDQVTLTGEDGTKITHIVQNLSVTGVNMDEDIVSGTADPGVELQVWAHEQSDPPVDVLVGADGTWLADLTDVYDIVPDTAGRSQILVDGNATAVDWAVPFIWADPLCECLNGWNWRYGDSVTIQVFDQNNNELEVQNPTRIYSAQNGAAYELGGDGIDLQPGYRIVMSNGQTVKELIISTLVVKEMNPVEKTISGVFDPSLDIFIHIGEQGPLSIETEDDLWVATFESLPLDGFGEVYQPDEDGDKTGMGWDGVPTFIRYDIYALNPESMDIEPITALYGIGEFDPSWSPNGEKIVHDVVYWDGSHVLYITDVKTHVSIPLIGAEDGANDAAWSPNGKWIAFDRRWVGEPNIYLVPDTGGTRQLVRNNAVRGDWAPNGKRIVFQQPSDESIRTVAANGGKGAETLIAPNGADPAWSPDGNWIAYVYDGNIWKVQVNIHGIVRGAPIQVTNVPDWSVGSPTWSPDSRTIIFNAGFGELSDIWKVSAFGGDPVWLTGSPDFGDYGPENARNSTRIAYAAVSP